MAGETGFTERVRQEISRAPLGSPATSRVELTAILHLAGALHLRGSVGDEDRFRVQLETGSGAVARRAFALIQSLYGLRPALSVRAPGGVRDRSTYGVMIEAEGRAVAGDVGLIDADGRPAADFPSLYDEPHEIRVAALRGAFLAAGSLSRPGGAPHFELRVANPDLARELAAVATSVVDGNVTVVRGEPVRVVAKSGDTIGQLLVALGANNSFLEWDERRLRRALRNEANRLANADAANLRRTIAAAAAQTEAVEQVLARLGWEQLDEDLRPVALARIANPTASLQELAELCDPPISKSAVHRRLQRLEELADEETTDPSA